MVNYPTSSCKIDLAPLQLFAENYTNYLSQIPYSGAESFKNFTATLIESQIEINKANSIDDLLTAQKKIGMSLSEVGFWMCGMEWYLRLAPEGAGPDKAPFKGISLTDTWNEWDKKHAKVFSESVKRRLNYQYGDKTNTCSGFIDLID